MLDNYKTKTEELLPYFVRTYTNLATDLATGVEYYKYPDSKPELTFTNLPELLPVSEYLWHMPHYNVTSICAELELPTNYFDYTPWRCLNGLGPFSDDGSVGRSYGWTNASTAAGGTKTLPSGRSAWYTTDYGWNGLQRALQLMVVTEIECEWSMTSVASNFHVADNWTTNTYESNSWASAKDAAEYFWFNPDDTNAHSNDQLTYDSDVSPSRTALGHEMFSGYYDAVLRNEWNTFRGYKGTNIAATVDFVVYAGPTNQDWTSIGGPIYQFSGQGEEWSPAWNVFDTADMVQASNEYQNIQGNQSETEKPTWPSEPGDEEDVTLGFALMAPDGFARWSFSYTNAVE